MFTTGWSLLPAFFVTVYGTAVVVSRGSWRSRILWGALALVGMLEVAGHFWRIIGH